MIRHALIRQFTHRSARSTDMDEEWTRMLEKLDVQTVGAMEEDATLDGSVAIRTAYVVPSWVPPEVAATIDPSTVRDGLVAVEVPDE